MSNSAIVYIITYRGERGGHNAQRITL